MSASLVGYMNNVSQPHQEPPKVVRGHVPYVLNSIMASYIFHIGSTHLVTMFELCCSSETCMPSPRLWWANTTLVCYTVPAIGTQVNNRLIWPKTLNLKKNY